MEVWVLSFYIVFGDSFRGGEYISADRCECACPARALEDDLQAPDHLALSADHSVKTFGRTAWTAAARGASDSGCGWREVVALPASALLDPRQHQGCERVAVLLHHHHVAIANNAAVAEIDVVRLGAILVEEFDNILVELARMVGVCGASHHQDPAAAIVREVADLELAVADVATLV